MFIEQIQRGTTRRERPNVAKVHHHSALANSGKKQKHVIDCI